MELKIFSHGFPVTPALKDACLDNFHQAISGFSSSKKYLCKIRLVADNTPQQPGPDRYWVKLEMTHPKVYLRIQHSSLYGAIEVAFDSLRRKLGQIIKHRRSQTKKHERPWKES